MTQCELEQVGIMIQAALTPKDVDGAFLDASIERVYNSDITTLKAYALNAQPNLRTVDLPNVRSVGSYALSSNPVLESINLPKVVSLDATMLSGNPYLTSVNLDSWETAPTNGSGRIFDSCTALTTLNLPSFRQGYTYSNTGTTVSYGNILGTSITHLTLGTSRTLNMCITSTTLQSVELTNTPEITGGRDFLNGASSLTSFTAPHLAVIGNGRAYNSSQNRGALSRCTSLVTLSLPELQTLGTYALAFNSNLATVALPKLATINSYAFQSCTSLETLTLPRASKIASNAFDGCSGLQQLTLGSEGYSVLTTTATSLANINAGATVTIYVGDPANVTLTGASANFGAPSGVTINYAQA